MARHHPIPRKTYPDPASMVEKAEMLQEILGTLDAWLKETSDLRELREIIELLEMATSAAVWQYRRAHAALKKLTRETGFLELAEIARKARQREVH